MPGPWIFCYLEKKMVPETDRHTSDTQMTDRQTSDTQMTDRQTDK